MTITTRLEQRVARNIDRPETHDVGSSGAIASAVAEVGGVILDLIFIPLPHRTLL